jgi:hypothetical protein
MRKLLESRIREPAQTAARALDWPRSKVSKQIQALEDSIGVQLRLRMTRSLHLTRSGGKTGRSGLPDTTLDCLRQVIERVFSEGLKPLAVFAVAL